MAFRVRWCLLAFTIPCLVFANGSTVQAASRLEFNQLVGGSTKQQFLDGERLESAYPVVIDIWGGSGARWIYYTLDGSAPTSLSTRYTSITKIHISNSVILSAISYDAADRTKFATGQLVIEIDRELYPEIGFTLAGNAQFAQSVRVYGSGEFQIGSSFDQGKIFYTLDGSTPTTQSMPYSNPVVATNSSVLRAIAFNSDFSRSVTGQITVDVELPFLLYSPLPPTTTTPPLVTFTPSAPDQRYHSNTVVTLTAQDGEGWIFSRWLGDVKSTNRTVSVVMDSNKRIEPEYRTEVSIPANVTKGRIQITPATPRYREVVTAVATPAEGYYFSGWGGTLAGNTNPAVFQVTNAMPGVTAEFSTLPAGEVSLVVKHLSNNPEQVRVTPRKNSYSIGEVVQVEVDLAATNSTPIQFPGNSQRFLGWAGDASGVTSSIQVVMDRSKVIETVLEPASPVEEKNLGSAWTTEYPAVANDGTVYVATGGALLSLSPDLKTNWVVQRPGIGGNPAIGDSGNIYVASPTGNAMCVDPNGQVLWEYVSGDLPPPSESLWSRRIALTADETFYFASGGAQSVYAVKAGALVRKLPNLQAGPVRDQVPVVGPDETLYFPTETGYAAHKPFGTVKWSAPYPQPKAIDANGRLYSLSGSNVVALDFSGQEVWRRTLAATPTSILIGEGGRVFASAEGGVTALDTNGVVIWTNKTHGKFAPLADGGGMIFEDRSIKDYGWYGYPEYLLRASIHHILPDGKNGEHSTYFNLGSSSKVAANQRQPVLTESGDLYAVWSQDLTFRRESLYHWKEAMGVAQSSWATPLGPRNTGRASVPDGSPQLLMLKYGSGWILRGRGTEAATLESSTNLQDWEAMGEVNEQVLIETQTTKGRFYRLRMN